MAEVYRLLPPQAHPVSNLLQAKAKRSACLVESSHPLENKRARTKKSEESWKPFAQLQQHGKQQQQPRLLYPDSLL